MIEDNNNEITEIKQINPWLDLFDLTDEEIKSVSLLISRVILGSDDLDTFYSKLTDTLKRDDENIKKIFLTIAKNKLLPLGDKVGDVEGFIGSLGGSLPDLPKESPKPLLEDRPKSLENNIASDEHSVSLSYSKEDDEEIQKIISSGANNSANPRNYNELADAIVSELGYNLEDEVLMKRLKNIIVFRLKDVRDELETMEILQKSKKTGGLEMSEAEATKTVAIATDKIKQGLVAPEVDITDGPSSGEIISFPAKQPFRSRRISLADKQAKSRPAESVQEEISDIVEAVQPAETVNVPQKPDVSQVELPQISEEDGLPVIQSPQGDDLMIPPKNLNKPVRSQLLSETRPKNVQPVKKEYQKPVAPARPDSIAPVQKPVAPKPFPQPRSAPVSPPKPQKKNRPSLDGVKVGSSLVGPVEELGTMTLIHFRRLGQTPYEAIAKVKEKIGLLEKESYASKLAGIDAWHKNEVTRFYRLLGQESMSQGRSVEDIISERLAQNKPTLSTEEFNSITEINRQLRY
jgi:hypothetical protein